MILQLKKQNSLTALEVLLSLSLNIQQPSYKQGLVLNMISVKLSTWEVSKMMPNKMNTFLLLACSHLVSLSKNMC